MPLVVVVRQRWPGWDDYSPAGARCAVSRTLTAMHSARRAGQSDVSRAGPARRPTHPARATSRRNAASAA
ncbi:hypothetical protein RSPO_c00833 [Ralstonia solanacearum Po82]|uniref:Uncharacterized protein n=1 Tax=Ralstonia solanacearum (strain Po82) TaxID=1031711 RepID=F6FYQ3_RALS8|nr:hypothetical protein RSPO_c00833 [Ralstonia solanacearum Po82]